MHARAILVSTFLGCALCACSSVGKFGNRQGDATPADEAAGNADATVGDGGGGGDSGGPTCVDVDGDGACRSVDCDDADAAIHPGQGEVCGNALDDNCDGQAEEGCTAAATSYFVDRASLGGTCADDNPGTQGSPWCTIAKANQAVGPGATVFIRAGTYVDETIQPAQSGLSESARVTYAAYAGESVTLQGSVYCVRLDGKSYVSIVGLAFSDCERNLSISAGSYNIVGYCSFDNPAGPVTWAGSRIYGGSRYNRIHHSVFSRYGAETYYDDSYQDTGCILDIGNDNTEDQSHNNLVTDNTFFYGGHHILGIYSNDNIVRRNTFHNEEWFPCNRTSIGGFCGNRNVIVNTSISTINVRNTIEDNIIVFSGVPPDQDSSSGLALRTRDNIVRRNIFYHNDSSGVGLSNDGGNGNDASNNHIYANVFYRNGYTLFDTWAPTHNGMMLARWVDDAEHNPMTGVAIRNNIFFENQGTTIYFYYVDEAEQEVSDNWETGDPGFVALPGEPDPSDFDLLDFHLQPTSPCINQGGFLTRTVGTGSNGTSLRVEDSGYFSDGKGLVSGDLIQLEGQTVVARVTAVDAATDTLTLATPLTWAAGVGVSLPYFGARPDQGVFEHEAP